MTREKWEYCIKTIIPNLKKEGVTLPQLQKELDWREMEQIFDGSDGLDEMLRAYSTEELDDAETLWDAEEDSTKELICNLEDFARWYGCETVDELERALFKNTECGMAYSATETALTLVGVVEGADCDGPSATLRYPFTVKEVKDAIEELETLAAEMWREWNCPDDTETTWNTEETFTSVSWWRKFLLWLRREEYRCHKCVDRYSCPAVNTGVCYPCPHYRKEVRILVLAADKYCCYRGQFLEQYRIFKEKNIKNDISPEKRILAYVVFDEEPEILGSGSTITFEQSFKDEASAMDALKHHDRLLRYVSENGRGYREYFDKETGTWS